MTNTADTPSEYAPNQVWEFVSNRKKHSLTIISVADGEVEFYDTVDGMLLHINGTYRMDIQRMRSQNKKHGAVYVGCVPDEEIAKTLAAIPKVYLH